MRRIRRALIYLWAFPSTAVGLILLPFARLGGGRMQVVAGVLEIHGGIVRWLLTHATLLPGGASAMTLGHIVIGRDLMALNFSRNHERVHVRQVERWGPLFLPAYLLSSAWLWLKGKDPYLDNPFEREAYASDGRFFR
jgi:hypothetical protein